MNPDGDPQPRELGLGIDPSYFEFFNPFEPLEPLEPLEQPLEPLGPWDGFQPVSPDSRPPSTASSYGSIDSGVSHPPRAGNKRKKRVEITWSVFDGLHQDGGESKARKRARKEEPDVDLLVQSAYQEPSFNYNKEHIESSLKRFACPFYKHDLQELQGFPTCAGPGWESFHQVEGHVFHRHRCPEFQCQRCYDEFDSEPALHDHLRADNVCEKKAVSGRINIQQEKQLRSRDTYREALYDEERWNTMYNIIFPDTVVIPSPFTQSLLEDSDSGPPCYYPNLLTGELERFSPTSEMLRWLEQPLTDPALGQYPLVMDETYEKEHSKQAENQAAPTFEFEMQWPESELDELFVLGNERFDT